MRELSGLGTQRMERYVITRIAARLIPAHGRNCVGRQERRDKKPLPYISAQQTNEEQKLRVLVAEAETPTRPQLVRLLARDCQVVCAETVRRAGWLVQRQHFDLVICDQGLPLSGGIALLHYVEILAPETMAILLTDQADRQMATLALKYGAFGCYVKPLREETIRQLLSMVRNGSQPWQ